MYASPFLFITALLAEAAVAMLFFCRLIDQHPTPTRRKWLSGLLAVLALASIAAYFDFGMYPKFGSFMNSHDFFHYYLGAKYSKEVGYYDLYPAVIVADTENNVEPSHTSYRRMTDYGFDSARNVRQNGRTRVYKQAFTEARWDEFRKDVTYFQKLLGKRWPEVVKDKGYNATPVWNMVAGAMANRIPTDGRLGLRPLVYLDLALLATTFVVVYRAFGLRTCMLAVTFFGTCFPMSFTHIRGAFLRLDWVTLLVIALCLIKRARYKTAGALMAYAGMARIFPVVFVFGLGAKWLWETVVRRRFRREYLEFFLVFAAGSLALVGLSLYVADGTAQWRDFFKKIALHNNDLSPHRIGFKYIFLMTYENAVGGWRAFEAQKMQMFSDLRALWWFIQAVVCLVSIRLVKDLEDYETVAYGYVLAFFLFAPTFYYHVMLLLPLFLFLPKLDRLPRTIGASAMFILSIVVYGLLTGFRLESLTLSFIVSCILLGLVLYIMTLAFFTKPCVESALLEEASVHGTPDAC
ncbi:MAG TPA: hypothetical protein HPP83_09205 [Candidatus Hydrogenedentes bacterium]|nr:hypothetical protein [Candidatus Hydrogenedentota bacterium]